MLSCEGGLLVNKPNINITSLSFKCSPREYEDFLRKYYAEQSVEILGGEYFIRSVDIIREQPSYIEKLNFPRYNPYEEIVSVEMGLFKWERICE